MVPGNPALQCCAGPHLAAPQPPAQGQPRPRWAAQAPQAAPGAHRADPSESLLMPSARRQTRRPCRAQPRCERPPARACAWQALPHPPEAPPPQRPTARQARPSAQGQRPRRGHAQRRRDDRVRQRPGRAAGRARGPRSRLQPRFPPQRRERCGAPRAAGGVVHAQRRRGGSRAARRRPRGRRRRPRGRRRRAPRRAALRLGRRAQRLALAHGVAHDRRVRLIRLRAGARSSALAECTHRRAGHRAAAFAPAVVTAQPQAGDRMPAQVSGLRLLLVALDVAVQRGEQAVEAQVALAVAPALHRLAALRARVVPARTRRPRDSAKPHVYPSKGCRQPEA